MTSRHEEPEIREGCRRSKARLLAKELVGSVPLRIGTSAPLDSKLEKLDAVLIDDDELARTTWRMTAKRLDKHLRTFASVEDFLVAARLIDARTPVYVDSDLGDGVQGEVEARRLIERGFAEVYLTTGHEPAKFAGLAHLRGVIGKAPPWT